MHLYRSLASPVDVPSFGETPVDGLVRTHWTLGVCVVCGHEHPPAGSAAEPAAQAAAPSCGRSRLYRQLRAES